MNSLFDITGKRAIVTGGSRGIGFVLARTLCEAGCKVAVTGSGDSIHAAAENLGPPDRVQGFIGDFQDSAAIERCFQEANAFLGGTDILVNNAGTQIRHPCEDFPLEDFQRLIQVNLVAAFQMAQLAGREMLAQGHGKIINIASMLSFFGGHNVPAYASSKGGLAQLTKSLSNGWAARGINCLLYTSPSGASTSMPWPPVIWPRTTPQPSGRTPCGTRRFSAASPPDDGAGRRIWPGRCCF